MIKAFLCAALCVATFSETQAQPRLREMFAGPGRADVQKIRRSMLQRQQPLRPAAKTTATMQRIVGYHTTFQGSPNDSGRYFYTSQERGSYHGPNDLVSYFFEFNVNGDNYPEIENNLEGGAPDVKCDSAVFRDGDNDVYRAIGMTYNSAHRPIGVRFNYKAFLTGLSRYRERYTLNYNSAGQRTDILFESDTVSTTMAGGPFIADSRMYTIYGGTPARALRDSTVELPGAPFQEGVSKVIYGYAGNNLTSLDYYGEDGATLKLYVRYRMNYDASNRLKLFEYFFDDGPGLLPVSKDSFTYTGNNPSATGEYFSNYNSISGVYEPGYSLRYTLNAQGLRDTIRSYSSNNTPAGIAVFQYNSYGNATGYDFINFSSTIVPFESARFYYELHNPTASIADALTQEVTVLTTYPNPVEHSASVAWSGVSKRPVLTVTDMSGWVMEKVMLPAGATTYTLDMSRYAAGTYCVSIADDGQVVQTTRLVKL